ncbi:hypothetical protein DRQ26_04725, partial [bacterium]
VALGFAISIAFPEEAKAQETLQGYLWEKRYEFWHDSTGTTDVDSLRLIFFKISLTGDTLPCMTDDTTWQFTTLTDTSGNIYYVNKRDTIVGEAGAMFDYFVISWVGEVGTQAELREKYSARRKDALEFYGDSTATKWVKVEQQEYDYIWQPIEADLYFVEFGLEEYKPPLRVYYRGRAPPYDETYWEAGVIGPYYYLPYSEIELSVENFINFSDNFELQFYPSPATGAVNIALGRGVFSGDAKLFDISGRLIFDIPFAGCEYVHIDVVSAGLKSGVYLVRLDGRNAQGKPVHLTGSFTVSR